MLQERNIVVKNQAHLNKIETVNAIIIAYAIKYAEELELRHRIIPLINYVRNCKRMHQASECTRYRVVT